MHHATKVRKVIADSVTALRLRQKSNGQFVSLASCNPDDFTTANRHQTTFITSLIVTSLASVPATFTIKTKAAEFILKERSAQWSWNYWLRNCADFRARPYPDDLDDTACALSALAATDKTLINQVALANFAKLLISQELQPGGPYSTWLVDSSAKAIWKDFDTAVNANIGYFLNFQDIKLTGLEDYITKQIIDDSLVSPYYLGEIPVIYFIARWYEGPGLNRLRQKVTELLRDPAELNDLQLSMLLTAAYNLNLSADLTNQVQDLLDRQSGWGWPAYALYSEPAVNGQPFFAGSAELTTALACEALYKYLQSESVKQTAQPTVTNTQSLPVLGTDSLSKKLIAKYQHYLQIITNQDTKGQITQIATLTAKSLKIECDEAMLTSFNNASLNGWASYTLFDDYFDGNRQADNLPVAMLALRRAGTSFRQGLPDSQDFSKYIEHALNIVDNANDWELTHCRSVGPATKISFDDLPEYKDLSQLADKSWGHTIASTGVLLATNHHLDSGAQTALHKFFFHYLIARQLNDDAHDWQDDLNNLHFSFVVTELLRNYLKTNHLKYVNPTVARSALQIYFWEHIISATIKLINENLSLARHALNNCRAIKDPTVFEAWLNDIHKATNQAALSKVEAETFIKTFIEK